MTCRCKSPEEHAQRAAGYAQEILLSEREARKREREAFIKAEEERAEREKCTNFTIVDAVQLGSHMILTVEYPSCPFCTFEGRKLMVFQNVNPLQALKWKKIDPHFRDMNKEKADPFCAPSPAARFPATPEGMKLAKLLTNLF